MTDRVFVVSDTHFNHANMLRFLDDKGEQFRGKLFRDTTHMNEHMIARWNEVVTPQDKVYHLGDVYMGQQDHADAILSRLNGKKRLIVGNHDTIYGKGNVLQKHFKKIYMWRIFKEYDACLTHVPINEDNFRKVNWNVHGHTHYKGSPKGPYISACVEMPWMNYQPILLTELIKLARRGVR